jgi:signal peptidase I
MAKDLSRRLFLVGITGVLGAACLARTRFCLNLVKGQSMQPGLSSRDLLVVDKMAYAGSAPRRGEVVVARALSDLIVKRIVGLPGEVVEVRLGTVLVNGAPLTESYAVAHGRLTLRSGTLLDDRYALLGDNRSLPASVSIHAILPRSSMVGRVVYTLRLESAKNPGRASAKEVGASYRPSTLGVG